jgi:hypothetical protein
MADHLKEIVDVDDPVAGRRCAMFPEHNAGAGGRV